MSPYELLGGTEGEGNRSRRSEVIITDKVSKQGQMICEFLSMDKDLQGYLIRYMKALQDMNGRGK